MTFAIELLLTITTAYAGVLNAAGSILSTSENTMTTSPCSAAGSGLPKTPDYNDDQVLHDLYILRQQLKVVGNVCLDIEQGEATMPQVFALIETSRVYADHIHRSLTAAAYASSEASS